MGNLLQAATFLGANLENWEGGEKEKTKKEENTG